MSVDGVQLYDAQGHRKYLTGDERARFLRAAERADRETRTLCYVLAYTGCHISEALALTTDRVDFANASVIFESLKKRRSGRYRAVPVPPGVLEAPLTSCMISKPHRSAHGPTRCISGRGPA